MSEKDVIPMTDEELADLLLLVDLAVPVTAIRDWTHTQKVAAENWAGACHLVASDNILNEFCRAHDEDAEYDPPFACICRPPTPEFLASYGPPARKHNGTVCSEVTQ